MEGGDESVFEHREAYCVPSTLDGGSADWLPDRVRKWDTMPPDGRILEDDTWKEELRGEAEATDSTTETVTQRKGDEVLNAHCNCKGVSFTIRRPDWDSAAFREEFPDFIIPPTDPAQRDFMTDVKNGTWWFPADHSKYRASACLCTSCRLSSGAELHAWSFIPTCFITLPSGEPFTPHFGTIKHYESSPNVWRRFCGVCGAIVFWQDMVARPGIIDVAVGVLDAEEGSRAEWWLSWAKREPSYKGDAVNKRLEGELCEGYMRWVMKT